MQGPRARGLDVSHFHPVTDWDALVGSPAKPTMIGIKATEGPSFTDPRLEDHQQGFRASPMLLAIYYHFARSGDPREQARRFLAAVGPLEPRERVALDLEVSPAAGPEASLAWVDAFYDELKQGASDRRPLIYTSKRQWDELCGGAAWLTQFSAAAKASTPM